MRFKGTYGLLLAFAVLGGYVYFTEFRGAEDRQKQEEARKKLFDGEAKDVTEITLEYEGRTVTAVRKKEKDWEITTPAGLEADADMWEQLALGFVQIQKEETVSSQKIELVPYGLDKPTVRVSAKFKGAASSVLFGAENPRKTFLYAKRADNDEVFLSPSASGTVFKKSLTELRNKKVLDFEAADIDSIRIAASGKPELEFQKSGMAWAIKKPMETGADVGEVTGFLSTIQFSRTPAFAEGSIDAKAAGMDEPPVTITLHDKKAGKDRVLLFGKSADKDKYFAKDQSRMPVFILGPEIFEKTQRALLDWRDKSVVRFGDKGTGVTDEIEVNRGTDKLVLKKTGMEWKSAEGQKVSETKLFSLLAALESARATQILDNPGNLAAFGLDKPRLIVSARAAGKDLATASFGRDNSSPAGVYVKGAGATVMSVPKAVYDALNIKMSDLVEAPPAPQNPAK